MTDPGADWPGLYREHAADVAAFVSGLDEADLGRSVPGTPSWTVKDVVAHLAGVAADNLDGRTEGAPGPAWTSRQVAERRLLPLAALVAELDGHRDAVARLAATSPGIVFDVAVHHADLHEAFGRPPLAPHLWEPIVAAVGPRRAPELVGTVPGYEVFRALFSRRSEDQMRAWDVGLDDARLADIPAFGARHDDQPVPD